METWGSGFISTYPLGRVPTSDSYPIGVDCHASHCMANAPHLFEDLKLKAVGEVEGIKQGLDIKGIGTFKFKMEDDNGKTHKIKIPNSLVVPDLK